MRKILPLATAFGPFDIRATGGDVPSEWTSRFLMAAKACGSGSQAERVALAPLDRSRLGLTPHMKFKHIDNTDRVLAYFRQVAKETESD